VKKKLSIVLAVVLTVILLLTFVTSAVYGSIWIVRENKLEMYYYTGDGEGDNPANCCGPCSGVSIGQYYREVIDRDEDGAVIEDFEWGSDGTSLGVEPPLGDVDWTVKKTGWWGNSVAEIDTDPNHVHSGTGSARFYHDGGYSYMRAYYSQTTPTYRSFYFKKDDNAVLYTITGYGNHRILVRVIRDNVYGYDRVQYYDGEWLNAFFIFPTEDGWHFIEFKNIDGTHATYDMRLDDCAAFYGAAMDEYSGYNGKTSYYNYNPCGVGSECWIDDIRDTTGDYPDLPDDDAMYDALYEAFGTDSECNTDGRNYGRGFREMAEDCGYYNFSYANKWFLNDDDDYGDGFPDDFKAIKDAIDNGCPVALGGDMTEVDEIWKDGDGQWPPTTGHFIAIRGYEYYENWYEPGDYKDFRIICTDSLSGSNNLYLDWDELIEKGRWLGTIIIKDIEYE